MRQLRNDGAKDWAINRLTTIGQACRAMTDETLRTTGQWAMTQITENSQEPTHIFAQLGLS